MLRIVSQNFFTLNFLLNVKIVIWQKLRFIFYKYVALHHVIMNPKVLDSNKLNCPIVSEGGAFRFTIH